jgi:hypothetical protein
MVVESLVDDGFGVVSPCDMVSNAVHLGELFRTIIAYVIRSRAAWHF